MNMSETKLSLKRNKLFLAFPGMGKTPLTFRNGKFKDVDFGTFRTAMGFAKEDEIELLPIFCNYLVALDDDWQGAVILTNEPKLAEYIHIDHMYLPYDYSFSAKKMGVSVDQIKEWVHDWYAIANAHKIPVTRVIVGLDDYLNGYRVFPNHNKGETTPRK